MSEGIQPTAALRDNVKALISELGGVNTAATALGIGREAAARIAAGLGVRRGTIALAMRAIEKRSATKKRRKKSKAS